MSGFATAVFCSCPPEPPIDYGRTWVIDRDLTVMACSRCGGKPRSEQDQKMAREFIAGMTRRPVNLSACASACCEYCGRYSPLGQCQGCGAPNAPIVIAYEPGMIIEFPPNRTVR